MADEGIKNEQADTSEDNEQFGQFQSELSQLQEQLAQMNQQYQNDMQSVVEAVTKSQQSKPVEDDPYMTDEEKQIRALRQEIEELKTTAPKQTQEILKRERDLNQTVVRLANDYPEIQSDEKVRQSVLNQHAKLPANLKETAEGYELAVQRAVAQAGLTPKSKRQAGMQNPDDFSSPGSKSGRSSEGASRKKAKVSERTIMVAKLLGRDVNDEKVLKGLEEAANRDTYNRYR